MRWFTLQGIVALATWVSGVAATAHGDTAQPDMMDVKQALGEKLSSDAEVFLPSNKGFDNATERWSLLEPPQVNIVAIPAIEDDVVQIVSIPWFINTGNSSN